MEGIKLSRSGGKHFLSIFKFIQSNVQSLSKNRAEIQRVLASNEVQVAILSEVWTNIVEESSNKYKIGGYHTILKSRFDGHGGSAILLETKYNFLPITLPTLTDKTQAVCIKILPTNVVVMSVYISPSIAINDFKEDISKLFNAVAQHQKVVVGGDFNAHHWAWGDEKCDSKGDMLVDQINASNLVICNDGSPTFIPLQLNKRSTALDISLASSDLFARITWTVTDFSIGSHHMALEIVLDTVDEMKSTFYVNRKLVQEEIAEWTDTDITSITDLKSSMKVAIKRNRFKNTRTPKCWWSPEVDEAWKAKTEARRSFNRASSQENLINFKKKAAVFQRLKREEIRRKFEELPEEVGPFTNSKELWAKVRRLTGHKVRRKENAVIFDSRADADVFLDTHFGRGEVVAMETTGKIADYPIITLEKWNGILGKKRKTTAPGEDGISYDDLRSLRTEVVENILKDINKMWFAGCIEDELKTIKVVAIPKPGRDQSAADGKRPISLVPTITKIANTAVLELLQEHLDINKILPDVSFGFRSGLSTTTCLSYVVNEVKRNKREKKLSALICIDLSNAFNAVKIEKLNETLCKIAVPDEVQSWIQSFLTNRKIQFQMRNEIISRTVSNGLPQGDVLSPTLFNIYTLPLHTIKVEGVVLVQYADDFGILVSAKSIDEINTKGQCFLNDFERIAGDLNFDINPVKTKAVLFQMSNNQLTIKVNNQLIETVRNTKYLGVTLDRTLSFGTHLRTTAEKVRERVKMLKVLTGIKSGAHPESVLKLHNGLVRSVIEYGSCVHNNARPTNRRAIEVLNNQSLRKATGTTKTTPINALVALSGQDPIHLRLEYIAAKEIVRNVSKRDAVASQLLSLPVATSVERIDVDYSFVEEMYMEHRNIFDAISPVIKLSVTPEIIINSSLDGMTTNKKDNNPVRLKQLVLCVMHGRFKNRKRVFTDASKEEGECGIGVYMEFSNQRISRCLKKETSITSAELIAIAVAVQTIENLNLHDCVIYTDSKSSCVMLNNVIEAGKGETMLVKIVEMAAKWNISLQWIPSHISIAGNDVADELAKQAVTNKTLPLENQILANDAFHYFKQRKRDETEKWYEEYSKTKGRTFYTIQPKYSDKPWFIDVKMRGRDIRLLNRLMTGHNYSKYWLSKMKIVSDAECEICEEAETAEHSILYCPRFNNIRSNFNFDGRYRCLEDMFKTNDIAVYEEMVQFVRATKLNL